MEEVSTIAVSPFDFGNTDSNRSIAKEIIRIDNVKSANV